MNDELLVYVKYDENNSIIAVRSNIFLDNTDGWTLVDQWEAGQDRYLYAHADNGEYVQEKYDKPLYDDQGRPNFHDNFVSWSDEEKQAKYLSMQEASEVAVQEANLQTMMFASMRTSFLMDLPNEQAATVPLCYPKWEEYIGKALPKEDDQGRVNRVQYGGKLWQVRQDINIVLENQPPGISTAALYEVIDVTHAGTLEDPIPYDQTMKVYNGKYYIEDGIIYLCTRDSGNPLYASCASLVPHYFDVAE